MSTSPPDYATVSDFKPTVAWNLPPGATQYHLQIIPANNDGPGLDLIRAAAGWYTLPEPPLWYGLLPGMTYGWRVRASDATTSIGGDHPSWGPWSPPRRFRTPASSASSVRPASPVSGTLVEEITPLLRWEETNPNVWYYEVQLSADPSFVTDPALATAAVYWELRHGAVTNPPRSYAVPPLFPLEEGKTYYWRVRPRVQGDGVPVTWSASASFRTGTFAAFQVVPGTAADPVTVANTLGAAIVVPPGAVGSDAAGNPGVIAFSIERTTTLPVALPPDAQHGEGTVLGSSVIFGPVGVPLERPIRLQLPIPAQTGDGLATIYRYDLGSGSWVNIGGNVERENSRITATVFQLGAYVTVTAPPGAEPNIRLGGPGRAMLRNLAGPGSNVWVAGCIESGTAQFGPNVMYGGWNDASIGVLAAPQGTAGWPNAVAWALPQGNYRFQLTRFSPQGTAWRSWSSIPVTIANWGEVVLDVDTSQGEWLPGRAPCAGPSLTTLGTGTVQVTLAWAAAADLDLAVIDPRGETVWFGNTVGRTGGRLDRDTHCGNYQLGRPENIFWPSGGAPRGRYRILVTYYRDCGGAPAQVNVAVRTIVASSAGTIYRSLVTRGDEREIGSFVVQ